MIRIISTSGNRATAEFPPTPSALLIIRGVPGRQWHPRRLLWSFPSRHLESVIEEYQDMGFRVTLDGHTQSGQGTNPFSLLQASMDPYLWRQVSSALLDLLDPAAGGDERLYRLLRRTRKVEAEQQRRPA